MRARVAPDWLFFPGFVGFGAFFFLPPVILPLGRVVKFLGEPVSTVSTTGDLGGHPVPSGQHICKIFSFDFRDENYKHSVFC